ncbi:hypothetical protein K0B96_13695 [Horticoccus luteus]|uniref:Na+/proline symporter n=1 Tax=Horticoccus luteus TaxID=2862869 RepID=A0A8F9TSD1_9BACT|nr:hypothetical protein [Horticoccus luteus]QYM78344.1 hypothetical protein K0B96_13695 [Horticoccus luteus]
MAGLHFLDYLVVGAYFAIIIVLGKIASKGVHSGESFFLAGRKLGKVYQFFLNFGNGTSASDSVSTSSVIYQQGASGVWVSLQMIFLNPYYWFMYPWFRRVRLTTTADLFEDRLGSRRLALFYATFQIVMAVAVTMGFSNLVSFKIASALVTKPEATWTVPERTAVQEYRALNDLETRPDHAALAPADQERRAILRERYARGELKSYISALNPWMFYAFYTVAIGFYIIMGGMASTALTEVFQGVLIVVFSAILIPAGLSAIGGWHQLGAKVAPEMFELFATGGTAEFTGWTIVAVLLATLLQTHAGVGNMGLAGSARNEFAARFGAAAGNYGKRFMTVLWAFCGLIAIAMFSGPHRLADPDLVWGAMSRQLLGPGLVGLMFAGVLAANMSTIAAQAMFVSALFARNLFGVVRPHASEAAIVRAGRWTIVVVLILGVLVATQLNSVYTVLQFAMTINVPFGAAILLMFIWRRVTAGAVWTAVIGAALLNIFLPLALQKVPAIATHPTFVARVSDGSGRPLPVYFESVQRMNPNDLGSALEGHGRFHTELALLKVVGIDPAHLAAGGRLAGRFFVDALLPLFLVVVASFVTRRPDQRRVDLFFGKMKTPVGATPAIDLAEIEATRHAPHRFDKAKLFPSSTWEFTKWNRTDAVGFALCCAVTFAIVGLLWGLLRLAAL